MLKTTIIHPNIQRYILPSPAGRAWGVGLILLLCLFLTACTSRPSAVPSAFTETSDSLCIYPDYRDVTIPPNIAPLNFIVTDDEATEFVATIGELVCGATTDGKMDIDTAVWRRVLLDARGTDLPVAVYAHRKNGWVRHPAFTIHVAEEDIDPYLTYRLIEPGYELYQQLGIYQRNLTNFDVTTIYENYRDPSAPDNHCINCHNFQSNNASRMYLHVREGNKGTIFTNGTEAHKILIRHDSILASGAYGNWHPTLPLVAYSTNKTAQFFHINYKEKIEVYDMASDLLLYDADHNEVRHIIHTNDHFETFPCWSADGTRLYYCDAKLPEFEYTNFEASLVAHYDSLHYDIYSIPFDTVTYTFGQPRIEVDASSSGLSASVPRLSPDGRWLTYALATYGQFHLYHRDADLWIKPISNNDGIPDNSTTGNFPLTSDTTGSALSVFPAWPLSATNSHEAESYHSWSSNSRWIAFSSRRDDSDFTRTYIAYIDANGRGHRAFLLPQRDPEYNLLLIKSYNVPELSRNPIPITQEQMNHVIRHTESEIAKYIQTTNP